MPRHRHRHLCASRSEISRGFFAELFDARKLWPIPGSMRLRGVDLCRTWRELVGEPSLTSAKGLYKDCMAVSSVTLKGVQILRYYTTFHSTTCLSSIDVYT